MAQIPSPIKKIINQYLKTLNSYISVEEAILFGSYASGNPRPDSDIDLIIISPDFNKKKFKNFIERLIWLSKMRRGACLNRAMDIFGYTKEEFDNLSKQSVVLKEAYEKGTVVNEEIYQKKLNKLNSHPFFSIRKS